MLELERAKFGKKIIISGFIALIAGGCAFIPSTASNININDCQADPSFVFIPEGKFIAGSDLQERDYGYQISAQTIAKNDSEIQQAEQKLRQSKWFDRENSRQNIKTNSFCISRHLVTNEEYLAFVRATGYQVPGISADDYQKQGFLVHPYSEVRAFLWQDGTYPQGKAKHPVVLVSYEDALAYAQWKGQQAGNSYRLPTAIEWEKAARGQDGRYFPWGNQWRDDATNWAGSKINYTSAIATYPLSRSPYGIEDMAGNVFEFTSTLQTTQQGEVSVMKGCSWDDSPGFCRAAYQHTRSISSRHILFGFRLVKE